MATKLFRRPPQTPRRTIQTQVARATVAKGTAATSKIVLNAVDKGLAGMSETGRTITTNRGAMVASEIAERANVARKALSTDSEIAHSVTGNRLAGLSEVAFHIATDPTFTAVHTYPQFLIWKNAHGIQYAEEKRLWNELVAYRLGQGQSFNKNNHEPEPTNNNEEVAKETEEIINTYDHTPNEPETKQQPAKEPTNISSSASIDVTENTSVTSETPKPLAQTISTAGPAVANQKSDSTNTKTTPPVSTVAETPPATIVTTPSQPTTSSPNNPDISIATPAEISLPASQQSASLQTNQAGNNLSITPSSTLPASTTTIPTTIAPVAKSTTPTLSTANLSIKTQKNATKPINLSLGALTQTNIPSHDNSVMQIKPLAKTELNTLNITAKQDILTSQLSPTKPQSNNIQPKSFTSTYTATKEGKLPTITIPKTTITSSGKSPATQTTKQPTVIHKVTPEVVTTTTPRFQDKPPAPAKPSVLSGLGKQVAEVKEAVEARQERDTEYNKKRAQIHELYAPLVKSEDEKSRLSKDALAWKSLVAENPEFKALQYANSKQQFDQIRERLNAESVRDGKGEKIPYNAWILFQASLELDRAMNNEAERDAELAEINKEEADTPLKKTKKAEKPVVEQPHLHTDQVFRQEYLTKVDQQVRDAQQKAGRKLTLQENQTLRKQLMLAAYADFARAYPNRAKFYAPYHTGLRDALLQQSKDARFAAIQNNSRIHIGNGVRSVPQTVSFSTAGGTVTRLKNFIQEAKIYPRQIPQTGMSTVSRQPYASNYPRTQAGQSSGGSGNGSGTANTASRQGGKKPQPQQKSKRAVPPPLASALRIASLIQRFWFAIPFIIIFLLILLLTAIIVVILGGGTGIDTAVAGPGTGSTDTNTPQITIVKSASSDKPDGSTGTINNGQSITYTLTVTAPNAASEIDVTDPLTFSVVGNPTSVSPKYDSFTANTLTWKFANTPDNFSQTITFTVKPTVTNIQVYNQASATISGATGSGGSSGGTAGDEASTPPSTNDCNGVYGSVTGKSSVDQPGGIGNFGDPRCTLAGTDGKFTNELNLVSNQLIQVIQQDNNPKFQCNTVIANPSVKINGVDPQVYCQVVEWMNMMTQYEAIFPNRPGLVDANSLECPVGGGSCSASGLNAYGLLQMNPHGQGINQYDSGDVDWQQQLFNGIHLDDYYLNGQFSGSYAQFCYWGSASPSSLNYAKNCPNFGQ